MINSRYSYCKFFIQLKTGPQLEVEPGEVITFTANYLRIENKKGEATIIPLIHVNQILEIPSKKRLS